MADPHDPGMDHWGFGRMVRALRQRLGWRQVDLATRTGVSRSVLSRIERGELGRIAWADLVMVAQAVGARLEFDLRWQGEGIDRLIDEHHASTVDVVVGLLERCGWQTDVEVSFSIFGERGAIDVVGRHRASGLLAVIEVKASIANVNETVITLDRKARLAPRIAKERGWICRDVATFLVVADGSTARARVARHATTFGAAFRLRGRACVAWLRRPVSPPPRGLFFAAVRHNDRTAVVARERVRAKRRGPASSRSRAAAERP